MHYPITDIQADFEINRPIRYQITTKRKYFHRQQKDKQTDGQTLNLLGRFFPKKNTNVFAKNGKLHKFATTNSNFKKINSFRHASS